MCVARECDCANKLPVKARRAMPIEEIPWRFVVHYDDLPLYRDRFKREPAAAERSSECVARYA